MIVLVHGVPETAAIFDRLRTHLPADTVAMSLPGFAGPAPFAGTKDDHVTWLARSLEGFDEPVHLVGHDWGAALAYRVAATRPELIRSWAGDAAYMMHPDYRWHDLARIWQTPVVGEAFWAAYLTSPTWIVAGPYRRFGLGPADARFVARLGNRHMARSVMRLYRSATPNVAADWGTLEAARTVPGMVIDAGLDSFGTGAHTRAVADRFGARLETWPDLGHWWALQDPARAADTLRTFWRSL